MASTEDKSIEIMRQLDVDYVLIIFGGLIGYSGDDINKFLWMVSTGLLGYFCTLMCCRIALQFTNIKIFSLPKTHLSQLVICDKLKFPLTCVSRGSNYNQVFCV